MSEDLTGMPKNAEKKVPDAVDEGELKDLAEKGRKILIPNLDKLLMKDPD